MAMSRSDGLLRSAIFLTAAALLIAGALAPDDHGHAAAWLAVAAAVAVASAMVPWRRLLALVGDGGAGRAAGAGTAASLVLLLRHPRFLDANMLAWLTDIAWLRRGSPHTTSRAKVTGASPLFVIHAAGRVFAVRNHASPYPGGSRAQRCGTASGAPAGHRAWIGVEAMPLRGRRHDGEAWRMVALLAAELAEEEDTLALMCPRSGRVVAFHREMMETLRGSDPLAVFSGSAAASRPSCGCRRNASGGVAEARARWGEFVAAFERRTDDQCFSVRASFRDGRHLEMMWMTVTALENGMVYGRLANQPVALRRLRMGMPVRVRERAVMDWLFTEGDHLRGGFTTDDMGRRAGSGA